MTNWMIQFFPRHCVIDKTFEPFSPEIIQAIFEGCHLEGIDVNLLAFTLLLEFIVHEWSKIDSLPNILQNVK
jgi:hypothetical protein